MNAGHALLAVEDHLRLAAMGLPPISERLAALEAETFVLRRRCQVLTAALRTIAEGARQRGDDRLAGAITALVATVEGQDGED